MYLSQVDANAIVLQHPMPNLEPFTPGPHQVQVELTPVGAQWTLRTTADLHALCRDMLVALKAVHAEDIVHRDVREANIVRISTGFVLIDWEVASDVGAPVFWHAGRRHNPPNVHIGAAWTKAMDLWQLGQVIARQGRNPGVATEASIGFATQLAHTHFADAAAALAALPLRW